MEFAMQLEEKSRREKWYRFFLLQIILFLLTGCGAACTVRLFWPEVSVTFLLGVSFAAAFACALFSVDTSRRHWLFFLYAGGILVMGAVFHNALIKGMISLWNMTAEEIWLQKGMVLPFFQTAAPEEAQLSMQYFLVIFLFVFCIFLYGMLQVGGPVMIMGFALMPFLWLWMGKPVSGGMAGLYCLGMLLELLYRGADEKMQVHTGNSFSAAVKGGVLFAAFLLCMCLVWKESGWEQKYVSPVVTEEWKLIIKDKINQYCYKKNAVNSLPEGRISGAGNWNYSEDTALKVTMEEPRSMYLRGFVGSTFKDGCWYPTENSVSYENRGLFYWLHQSGFYGNMQLFGINELLKGDNRKASLQVQVENEGADSRYLYVPYEMSSLPEKTRQGGTDDVLMAKGLLGQRSYSFETAENMTSQFTDLAAQAYLWLEKHPQSDYRLNESYYNQFVYDNCTELSDSYKNFFRQILGSAGNQEESHPDYASVIKKIRGYLENTMTYTNYPETDGRGEDGVRNFLDRKAGYSIHYASAAALMFRYYGIPSRYAEGYLITEEDVKDAENGQTMNISGERGHAWTEIYIDGMGWVPIEMTPEYYGVMEEPDLGIGLEASGKKAARPEEPQAPQQEEQEISLRNVLSVVLAGIGAAVLLLVQVFDIIILLFMVWVFGKRIIRNFIRRKRFSDRDCRKAVTFAVQDLSRLYRLNSSVLSDASKDEYKRAYRLGEKAAFSQHNIEERERSQVLLCRRNLIKEIKKKKGFFDKWVMKYIEEAY